MAELTPKALLREAREAVQEGAALVRQAGGAPGSGMADALALQSIANAGLAIAAALVVLAESYEPKSQADYPDLTDF